MVEIGEWIHPLSLARLKAAVTAGVAVPARKYLHAESQFYRDISAQISNLDSVYIFMSDVKAYGFRSLVGTLTGAEVGTITQTNFRGIGASANTNYLNMGTPSSWNGIFGASNNSMGVYVAAKGTAGATNVYLMGGLASDVTGFRLATNAAMTLFGYYNSNNVNNAHTLTMANNTTYATRRSGSDVDFLAGGSVAASASNVASGNAMTAPQFVLNARQTGPPIYLNGIPSDMIIGAVYYGNFSVDNAVMHNAFNNMYNRLQ